LICFEWLQRPENVLEGYIKWPDHQPPDHPNHVQVMHLGLASVYGTRWRMRRAASIRMLLMLGTPIVLTLGKRGALAGSCERRAVTLALAST
jgi:hypothetical protein